MKNKTIFILAAALIFLGVVFLLQDNEKGSQARPYFASLFVKFVDAETGSDLNALAKITYSVGDNGEIVPAAKTFSKSKQGKTALVTILKAPASAECLADIREPGESWLDEGSKNYCGVMAYETITVFFEKEGYERAQIKIVDDPQFAPGEAGITSEGEAIAPTVTLPLTRKP